MGAQNIYSQLPPGMGDIAFPGAPPTPPPVAPQKPFWDGPNLGTAIGAGAGLVFGGLGGAAAGAGAGRLLGRGVKYLNNRLPDASGVPAITPAAPPPQAATGGIFGQGRRMVGGAAQKIMAAVRSGAMPIEAAAKALGMDTGSLRDSLSSMGSAGGGMGQGWGGGSSYTGGFYGGDHSGYSSGGFHGGGYNPNR